MGIIATHSTERISVQTIYRNRGEPGDCQRKKQINHNADRERQKKDFRAGKQKITTAEKADSPLLKAN